MRKDLLTIDIAPVEREVLNAEAFLTLVKNNPSIIRSSKIVHPAPGKKGFGEFLVHYTRPIYKQPA